MNKLTQYLQVSAQEIETATLSLTEVTQDWQVILEFLKNRLENFKLNKRQQEKLRRYQFAYAQSATGRFTDLEVINLLKIEFKINKTQAYEDVRCMREIYGVVAPINKQFELQLELQVNRRLMIKAEDLDDMPSLVQLGRNRIALLKEVQVMDDHPAEDFKGHIIEPVFAPQLINTDVIDMHEVLRIINEKRDKKLNLSTILTGVTDIPHEDLSTADPL